MGVAVLAHAKLHGHHAKLARGATGHKHKGAATEPHHGPVGHGRYSGPVCFDDGPHKGPGQQLVVFPVEVGVHAHGALLADGATDEVDAGRALGTRRVVAQAETHQLAFLELGHVPLKHGQLHVQVLGVHYLEQDIGGRHALAHVHIHGLHKTAHRGPQPGRGDDGAAHWQAARAQAGSQRGGFGLQAFKIGAGALEVFLRRHFLPVQLGLPLVFGLGVAQLRAGFQVVLLELRKVRVANGGQDLAFAHPRALQQLGAVHKAPERGTDRRQLVGRHVEHAIHLQPLAQCPVADAPEPHPAQALLLN